MGVEQAAIREAADRHEKAGSPTKHLVWSTAKVLRKNKGKKITLTSFSEN
jgi:hypothetical protein